MANPAQRLVCATCFSGVTRYNLKIDKARSVSYYACANCQQSQTFLEVSKSVIALLDTSINLAYVQHDIRHLRVNWLQQRALFEFDAVEIVSASDEEVERFAVQVGNDTDKTRAARYKAMPCAISPDCQLSQNSLRILDRTFGTITEMK